MAGSPFRERRLSPEEVRRVVQRAAELAPGEALTASELERRLGALGVPAEVVKQAMELPAPTAVEGADGALRIDSEVVVEGAVPVERFEAIADAISAVMKMPGQISAVGSKLTWTPGGVRQEPRVTLQVKEGRTVIRYTELIAQRGQARWGFGVLAGFGGMGAGAFGTVAGVAIAKGAEVSAAHGAPVVFGLAAVLGLATAIGSYLGLSRSLARRAQTRAAFAAEVLARVESAARANLAVRTRVEASSSEGTSEAEDELEGEVAELGRQRL